MLGDHRLAKQLPTRVRHGVGGCVVEGGSEVDDIWPQTDTEGALHVYGHSINEMSHGSEQVRETHTHTHTQTDYLLNIMMSDSRSIWSSHIFCSRPAAHIS